MTPQYELRMIVESTSVWRLEIWQTISPATPRLKAPEHVATIQGPGLRIAENRLLKRLAREKIVLGSLRWRWTQNPATISEPLIAVRAVRASRHHVRVSGRAAVCPVSSHISADIPVFATVSMTCSAESWPAFRAKTRLRPVLMTALVGRALLAKLSDVSQQNDSVQDGNAEQRDEADTG
jgi:hypothetical protein